METQTRVHSCNGTQAKQGSTETDTTHNKQDTMATHHTPKRTALTHSATQQHKHA